jgi:transmembrane sensor
MPERQATMPKGLRTSPRWWRWIASLGFLAVVCAGVAWIAAPAPRERAAAKPVAPETIVSTDIGERGSVELPDGTRLVLNTNSRVRANRTSRRIVVEQGEVIADVPPPSAAREFSNIPVVFGIAGVDVEAPAAAQLRIRLDDQGTVLVDVLAGESVLRPMSPQQIIDLIVGETALIKPGDVVVVTEYEPSRLHRELLWQDGELCLEGETIQEAIAQFNRYNRQKLVVMDKRLADRRVGGRFETTDVEGFVDALQHLYGVRVLAVRSGGKGASTLVLLPAERDA